MDICGTQAVYLPPLNCDDCSGFEERLRRLEEIIANLGVDEVLFTISGTLACEAVVCESTLCGDISTESTAEDVINSLRNYEGYNIILDVNGTQYTLDTFEILNETGNSYRLTFDVFDKDSRYIIEGDDNTVTYYYE